MTKHAALLKKIAEVLSMLALFVAVLALCFTGVGVLALIAIGLTAGAAVTRLALASTGNGSWADFGLEVVVLATFGLGKWAAHGVRGAHALTAGRAANASRTARAATQGRRVQLANQLGRRGTSPAAKTAARRELDQLKKAADDLKRAARPRDLDRIPASEADLLRSGGDLGTAHRVSDMARLNRAFPSLPLEGAGHLRLAQGSFYAGAGTDIADKMAGSSDLFPDKPHIRPYQEFKDRTTTP